MGPELWEAYYRSGALAACPTSADGDYGGELRKIWVDFFATLANDARVLDVATGNGAIASIAAATAAGNGAQWDIHGSDKAAVDPHRDVADGARRLAGIRFHPRTATEALPFEDASFDAVGGQFALEYSDVPAALAELHRVLRPRGHAQFVLHHADSAFAGAARRAVEEAALLSAQGVYPRLRRLVGMERGSATVIEAAAAELRTAIRALKSRLPEARAAGGGRVLEVALDAVQQLLVARNRGYSPRLAGEVDRAEAGLRASLARMEDLLARASDQAGMEAIQRQAAAAGFGAIECLPVRQDGEILAWQLLMQRP